VTPEAAVRQRILDLNTSAGARVYQLKLPQKLGTWPAVRVQAIDDPENYHLRGGSGMRKARVQVDCYSPEGTAETPYADVSTLAEEINGDDAGSGLSGFAGWIDDLYVSAMLRIDRRPLYEGGELRLVRMQMDYWVHYMT
jgi:hypothetical protein